MKFHMIFIQQKPQNRAKYIDSFKESLKIHEFESVPKEFTHFENPAKAYSNYLRVKIIQENGGYYVDNDYYMLKTFPNFLKDYKYVFTRYPDGGIINSFFGGQKGDKGFSLLLQEIESLIPKCTKNWEIGSALFTKNFQNLRNAKYVGSNFYAKTNGYLYHDSISARNVRLVSFFNSESGKTQKITKLITHTAQ